MLEAHLGPIIYANLILISPLLVFQLHNSLQSLMYILITNRLYAVKGSSSLNNGFRCIAHCRYFKTLNINTWFVSSYFMYFYYILSPLALYPSIWPFICTHFDLFVQNRKREAMNVHFADIFSILFWLYSMPSYLFYVFDTIW